ncbi:MAG: Ppx/GppA family phosphatase [Candidatus Kapabacteria bacterium]|nr:Ppx/GppA family phosphatase [Candidatus Kapabacteria bacterium]
MKIASIDIGTNTLLLLLGEHNNTVKSDFQTTDIVILNDIHSIARLGEGVSRTGVISDEAFARSADILHHYKYLCDAHNVAHITAVATSAVRDAQNGHSVCERLGAILNCEIHCISGDEEARFSFIGTNETGDLCTVVDIGGGSTEYVTGENNTISHRMSLQIGAVRLHERFLLSLPPSPKSIIAAREEIRSQLAPLPQAQAPSAATFAPGDIIGVGGTFTTLAAIDLHLAEYDSARVHNHIMTLETVSHITNHLLTTPLSELLENPAIHPQRADILPAGALILEETLLFFGAASCKASTKGLRYGVLYDAFAQWFMHNHNYTQ